MQIFLGLHVVEFLVSIVDAYISLFNWNLHLQAQE